MKQNKLATTIKAVAVAGLIASAPMSFAASGSSTSAIMGSVTAAHASDYTIAINDPKTGSSRDISIGNDGKYRFSKMPSGTYNITISKGDKIVAEQTVAISLGSNSTANFDLSQLDTMEEVVVVGGRIKAVDVSTTGSGLIMTEAEIDLMPIARDIQSIALLAPGVVQGDTNFTSTGAGVLASFGGSSIAENSCYINGLEVTNTRKGIDCGSVPFEFYQQFQVKTGGFSAQYGRSTGGVLNAITKSGTNEWEFGFTSSIKPSSFQKDGQVSRSLGGTGREIFRDTRDDESTSKEMTFSAGGPIIKDKLFVYALVNPRDTSHEFAYFDGYDESAGITQFKKRESSGNDNLFWGTKVDWDISENHRLSYFAYSDRNDAEEKIYERDSVTGKVGGLIGTDERLRGGEAQSLTYTGYITDNITISAMYGEIESEYTTNPNVDPNCPSVTDQRSVPAGELAVSCGSGGSIGVSFDENEQFRFDIEYAIGDHTLSAGVDIQERVSMSTDAPVGGHSYQYDTLAAAGQLIGSGGTIYTNNTGSAIDYVEDRIFVGGGEFKSELEAYYIEDSWQVTDDIILNLGLRWDNFESFGVTGKTFTNFETDPAPRIGVSWDINGDGTSKLYANFGVYYLPVANNTVRRIASGISDTTTYYTFTGIDGTNGSPVGAAPITGDTLSSTDVSGVPQVPVQAVYQAKEADPFSKNEWIIGYERMLNDEYSASVRYVHREIETALDDYCGKWAYPHCVMVNPGSKSSWYKDGAYWNGSDWDLADGVAAWYLDPRLDGQPDEGSFRTHSVEEMALPEAENDYDAIQTQLNYRSDDFRWTMIYTWSRSTGNFEGAVKSDIGQSDAGITQDFDFGALMDGAQGYQPNDRRHVFKLFGSYDITPAWTVGFNTQLASGRPGNIFGAAHPNDDPNFNGGWGDSYYVYTNNCPDANSNGTCEQSEKEYSFNRRGTAGRNSWIFNLDVSSSYTFEVNGIDMRASVDVFNLLNTQQVTNSNEHYESSEGTQNKFYGAAYNWQKPRYVRLGIEARF